MSGSRRPRAERDPTTIQALEPSGHTSATIRSARRSMAGDRRRARSRPPPDAERSAAAGSGRCPSTPTRTRRCSSSRTCARTSRSSRATVKAVDGVSLPARARRGAGHRRRVRLRQDDDRAVARPDPAVRTRRIVEGSVKLMGIDLVAQDRERPAALPLARDQHRLPGRDERAQPGPPRPRPDRRADRGAARRVARRPRASGPASCSSWSASRGSAARRTRTSCRAGCASGR